MLQNLPPTKKMDKSKYTPLGELFYATEEWKRKKVLYECEKAGVPYPTIRTYFTRVKGFRVPADVQKIILDTLPEAADFFLRPQPEKVS
jgi:hypothetical protein